MWLQISLEKLRKEFDSQNHVNSFTFCIALEKISKTRYNQILQFNFDFLTNDYTDAVEAFPS